jgi:hypothetical protein
MHSHRQDRHQLALGELDVSRRGAPTIRPRLGMLFNASNA